MKLNRQPSPLLNKTWNLLLLTVIMNTAYITVKDPAEAHRQVWDFLAALNTNWSPLAVFCYFVRLWSF